MSEPNMSDPILEEVRLNRERLIKASGGTLDSLFAFLKECERNESRPVVKLPKLPIDEAGGDAA